MQLVLLKDDNGRSFETHGSAPNALVVLALTHGSVVDRAGLLAPDHRTNGHEECKGSRGRDHCLRQ